MSDVINPAFNVKRLGQNLRTKRAIVFRTIGKFEIPIFNPCYDKDFVTGDMREIKYRGHIHQKMKNLLVVEIVITDLEMYEKCPEFSNEISEQISKIVKDNKFKIFGYLKNTGKRPDEYYAGKPSLEGSNFAYVVEISKVPQFKSTHIDLVSHFDKRLKKYNKIKDIMKTVIQLPHELHSITMRKIHNEYTLLPYFRTFDTLRTIL